MEDRIRATGENTVLAGEIVERTANEASAALAAIRLVRVVRGSHARAKLLHQASARIEGLAAINRYLVLSFDGPVDVGEALERIVQAIAAGRSRPHRRVTLNLQSVRIAPTQARRLLLIAYERAGGGKGKYEDEHR
jgi:two-component sensor histidine kinase